MWNGVNLELLGTGSLSDGHAHVNRLLSKEEGRYGWNLSHHSVEQIIVGTENNRHLHRIMGKVVANFIDPQDWWNGSVTDLMIQCARNPKIYITLGCHPQSGNWWKTECHEYLF